MKKKGKKAKHKDDDSFNDQSDVDNGDTPGKRSGGSKTRLRRRRREGSNARSDSDSSDKDRKQKKRRKRRKRSRTTTGTTEESSQWDEVRSRKGSKITTEDEESKEKSKEVTEKDLVEKIQQMVPYLPPDSPLWTKWTLAPIYHFIRNPNAVLVVAFILEVKDDHKSQIPNVVRRLLKLYQLEDTTTTFNQTVLVTFNQLIPGYTGELFYFVKSTPIKINSENFEDAISFGNTVDGHIRSLNSLLIHFWTRLLIEEESLPKGIKDEVLTDLNTLSCSSQSTTHLLDTHEALLYVPQEAILSESSDHALSKDKEFCDRLEETVVYWLTKLKQVISLKELDDTDGWPGPLDEIKFWQSRSKNLSGILTQMRSSPVRRLLQVLASSRSPYIIQLRSVLKEIQEASNESASNYHYLQSLTQPCAAFPSIKLSEVKTRMQKLLWLVLIIKGNAPFYNSPNRLNGLLRKFSNVLILMCQKRVKLNSLLQGKFIKSSEKTINQCLKCLAWWKEVYNSTKEMSLKMEEWIFEYDQIFVHVDAMNSRLNDLLEICAVQRLYGRRMDDTGEITPLPLYPGVKGPYIANLMGKIGIGINSKIGEVVKISRLVLDVKNTEWIIHMNNVQAEVLSAEMSIQNLLEEVFDQMANLRQRLELLHLFYRFYSRDIIMRQIDKLAIQLYEYFEDEVLKLRKLFELKVVPLPKTYSHMAGRGAWAIYMKKRIESHLDLLKKADDWLPKSLFGDSVKSEAKSLSEAMAAFSQKTYEDWSTSKEILDGKDFRAKLDIPLLVRGGRTKKGIVEINFDRNLFRILAEAEIWARVGRPVPLVLLLSIYTSREKLHSIRENVSLVAKFYNDVISRLSRDEMLLFQERLLPLEKKIYPCVTTYTWSSSLVADHIFVEEFQQMSGEVMQSIKTYHSTNLKVAEIIQKISHRLMVKITPKTVYEPEEFRSTQNELIMKQLKRIVKDYQNIAKMLRELFKVFHGDGPEVKVQWGKYVKLVDDCVEEALCLSLRNSLEIVESSVCFSNKPLFLLRITLDNKAISFRPSLEELAGMIFGVKRNIAMALEHLSKISRYTGSPSDLAKTERSFTNALLNDPVSLEIQGRIKFSIERCFSELNLYSERWTPYRDIWEVDRSTFMEKYGDRYPSVAGYERDMAKYTEISEVVHGSEDFVSIRFLRLDCTQLKTEISEGSMDWFQLIAGTLYSTGKGMLEDLYNYMEGNKRKFSREPETLDEQLDLFRLLEDLKREVRHRSFFFPTINEQFGILNKFQFQIESDVNDQVLKMEREWRDYRKYLKEADKKLQKSYDKLRNAFLDCAQDLKGKVNELLKFFEKNGPFSRENLLTGQDNVTDKEEYWEQAITSLENIQNDVTALKKEELKVNSSLKFFGVDKEADPNLISIENEIESLAIVWSQLKEWESHWMTWKSIQIEGLNIIEVGRIAAEFLLKFQQLEKQFEEKSWPVISETGEFILNVQACLRTVDFLKNTSLRSRHWDRIKSLVGESTYFPQNVARPGEFNLNTVVNLGLHRYLEQLSQISLSSGKETAIEAILKKVQDFWNQETFILEQRKGLVPFRIRCRAHLQDKLMDHIVSLSAMKGSPFIWPFVEQVDYWGGLLPQVSEVLEQLLVTQKEWMFLEKVFSNEDIRREVPQQATQFKAVSHQWAAIVLVLTEERNVAKVVKMTENFTEMLEDMEMQMDILRNDLNIWLLDKRQEFPRLYFILDHELLECLGNSRDPQEILLILQKLFGNLSQLKLSYKKPSKIVEIHGVLSATKECLTFPQPISTSGSLTSWLTEMEWSIKSSVKLDIQQCLEYIQQNPNKQEEWLLEMTWLCQSYLTATHINWTLDVTNAIYISSLNAGEVPLGSGLGSELSLKKINKRLKRNTAKLSEILQRWRQKLEINMIPTSQRLKLEEMLVKYIHLRDITERLHSRYCSDLNSFEWLQHIRFYLEDCWSTTKHEIENDIIVMKQGFAGIEYGYEFTGWGQKFVMSPLAERSILALTTAISFHYGGLIQGAPGVGKTETINQLGRLLGIHIVNVNLSPSTEFSDLGRIMLGLVQTGSWGILQDIDQVTPHVLSLLASKLALITKAKSDNVDMLMLDGVEAMMERNCGIFAIMRKHAKDDYYEDCLSSIRAVTRPVAMIRPDIRNILDVNLFIAGFENSAKLATKVEEIFTKAKEIIYTENRCGSSIASMLSLVTQARHYKETYKRKLNESEAIVKSLQNITMPALSQEEQVGFGNLIKDHFPFDCPLKMENQLTEAAICNSIKELGLQSSEKLVKQCMRLQEIMQLHPVTIVVGDTGSGKSVLRKVLKNALQKLHNYRIQEFVINPATLEPDEMLGYCSRKTGKWKDGIFANILKGHRSCKKIRSKEDDFITEPATMDLSEEVVPLWIVLDGPVKGHFMEGIIQQMHKLCKHKNLTFNSKIYIIIETDELTSATPCLIAQSGAIFVDYNPASWRLPLRSWLNGLPKSKLKSELPNYALKLIESSLEFLKQNCSSHLGDCSPPSHAIISVFTNLMESFSVELAGVEKDLEEDEDRLSLVLQKINGFCIVWSVFGTVMEESQLKASAFIKDLQETRVFPTKGTVFDYFFEFKTLKWVEWKCLLSGQFRPSTEESYNRRSIVDTETTARCEYFLARYENQCPALVTGHTNSGKSGVITSALNSTKSIFNEANSWLHIRMTPKMTGRCVQSLIESRLERVSSLVLSPSKGKRLTVFIDDLHAYSSSSSGLFSSLPHSTLSASSFSSSYFEFLRTLIEHKMWYDRETGAGSAISNVWIVAASTLNNKGRNSPIPARLRSKFAMVYLSAPDEFQLRKIFTTKLSSKLKDFASAVKLMADDITVATLDTFRKISTQLQPVSSMPLHTCFSFSIHDISCVYEGLLRADKGVQDTKHSFVRLWFHECSRVFHDRFMDASSRQKCREILTEQLLKHFEVPLGSLFPQTGGTPTLFGSFMGGSRTKVYEEIKDEPALGRVLKIVGHQLRKNWKDDFGNSFLERDLVLFRLAVVQTARIARILSMKKGHLIICGRGGQGRQTLTRLAATLLNFEIFDLCSSSKYTSSVLGNESVLLRQQLKCAYRTCALKNLGCCLILAEEYISEDVLDLISVVTSTAEIADLYTKKELQEMMTGHIEMTEIGRRKLDGNISDFLEFMRERVEQNLHVVLCLNPKNEIFRKGIKQYPWLLKQMSVSWFDIWRRESFLEVVKGFLPPSNENALAETDDPISTGSIFWTFHSIAEQLGEKAMETGLLRFSSITPSHFLHFVDLYLRMTDELTSSTEGRLKMLQNAMAEINKVKAKIGNLTEQALVAEEKVNASKDECQYLLEILQKQEKDTNEQEAIVTDKSGQLNAEVKEFDELTEVIRKEWTSSMEGFEESTSELQDLSDEDITHIRSYYSPPPLVSRVLDAVMIMLDRDQTWPEAKVQLGHPDFIRRIMNFDKASVTMDKLNSLRIFLQNPEFTPDAVAKYSNGARILCGWIHAMDKYCRTYLTQILPKREKLEEVELTTEEGRYALELNCQKLDLLKENLTEHRSNYQAKLQLKENYEQDSNHWNELLERAESVLELLKVDQVHWEKEVGQLETKLANVRGDGLLSSACIAYLGPFDSELRTIIKNKWTEELNRRKVSSSVPVQVSENWSINAVIENMLGTVHPPVYEDIRHGNTDYTDNRTILRRARQKLLIVDPFDIGENIDAASQNTKEIQSNLACVASSYKKTPGCEGISLSKLVSVYENALGKNIDMDEKPKSNEEDQLPMHPILCIKDNNPYFGSEVTSHFYIVNFVLSAKELKFYLAQWIAELTNPQLESKTRLLHQLAGKEHEKILRYKENVPRLALKYGEAILDNGEFPDALTRLKSDLLQAEIMYQEKLEELKQLELKRQQFLPIAEKVRCIYTALSDLAEALPEYEMSLNVFISLIAKILNKYQTSCTPTCDGEITEFLDGGGCKILLRQIAQSMFHRDRYVFVLILCITFLQNEAVSGRYCPTLEELSFLSKMRRNTVCDNDYIDNGVDQDEELTFLTKDQFRKLQELGTIANYDGLLDSIKQDETAWGTWLQYLEPENKFPTNAKLGTFQKLVVLSVLRPDRLHIQIRVLVLEVLGPEYNFLVSIHCPIDLNEVYCDYEFPGTTSSPVIPILFLLNEPSACKVDPLISIQALVKSLKPQQKFYHLSVSHENMPLAWKLLEEGVEHGYWIYFSNCNLSSEWMSELGSKFEELQKLIKIHKNFCMWMSTERNVEGFPKNVLRNSMKIAVDATQNLQTSMSRLFRKMSEVISVPNSPIERTADSDTFNKLLYALSYLHCSLTGRRKFLFSDILSSTELTFQDIDFEISAAILKLFVSTYALEEMPWWAMKLSLNLQYTNHFLSEWDQPNHCLVQDLLEGLIRKDLILEPGHSLSSSCPLLRMPSDGGGDLTSYRKFLEANISSSKDEEDNPEVYGLDSSLGMLRNTYQAKSLLHSMGQVLTRMLSKLILRDQAWIFLNDDRQAGQQTEK